MDNGDALLCQRRRRPAAGACCLCRL